MLALDHMMLYQMVSDPAFFTRVPVFFFMREQAKAVVDQIVAQVVDGKRATNECAGCGNVRQMMEPVMLTFVSQVRSLAKSGPQGLQALEPLIAYVSERRGFRPRPIRVYYKENGKVDAVDL